MNKEVIKKTVIITLILTICFQISTRFLWANWENNTELLSAKSKEAYGQIGVALSTNIGIRFKERRELPISNNNSVIEISELLGREDMIGDELIKANMLYISEYFNIMKTNINSLLKESNNRGETLDNIIAQFELRYKNASKNLATLQKQNQNLEWKMNSIDAQIEQLKIKINADFKAWNTIETVENKDEYLRLKSIWTEARTYIIYYNKFINQYNYLNNYNKQVLDALINNRDIIAKDSYLVFPDTGNGILKDLNLLFTEEEYKAEKKNIEE